MISSALFCLFLVSAVPAEAERHFTITIVDEQTGRGVPLVELRTVNAVRSYSDSNGIVAFFQKDLMDQDVFFHVTSHGYEFPADGFGFRGKTLRVVPGGKAKLVIKRINIAQRLYRITGSGIYADSVVVGAKVPIQEPLLNGQVVGCDSVLNAVYKNKLRWFWGDTMRPAHPLGIYDVPSAVSTLPADGGLDPDKGVDLTYVVDKTGFARSVMKMPGAGPTWMTALAPLQDDDGAERLYASFVKIDSPLKVYARGLAVWNDEEEQFEKLTDVGMNVPAFADGHSFRHTDNGRDFLYFAHPYASIRVRATPAAFRKIDEYECFTCLKQGSNFDDASIDRDAKGQLVYSWKKNTPALDYERERKLIAAGKIKRHEARFALRDRDSGKIVVAHSGSVCWNAYRKKWVMIAVQAGGTSYLGEVWYAEADELTGPWDYAVKVVTHEKYSFYNPKQHPMFDKEGGRVIYFEGTYSNTFSGNAEQTPRYDYNQIMYKLELIDKRLSLPKPVRLVNAAEPFFALDRPGINSVPVVNDNGRLRIGNANEKGVVFHALPSDSKDARGTVGLYEFHDANEKRFAYSTNPERTIEGLKRDEKPLCWIWQKSLD